MSSYHDTDTTRTTRRTLGRGAPEPRRHGHPHLDHVSHAKPGIQPFPDRLYVITVVSNPIRYRSRYELYREFEARVEEAGGILYTVEAAFAGREFELTEASDPRDIQLRTTSELWHKENMINIGISRLPSDWKYVAWIDSDIAFARPDWAQETIQQLQHYQFVQMFSHAQDLSSKYAPLPEGIFEGFAYSYRLGREAPYKYWIQSYPGGSKPVSGDMKLWHPGYAWAARREAIDAVGGLIDWAILGSADHNMAAGLTGIIESTVNQEVNPSFKRWMDIWQERAEKQIRRNVGYVDGLILHQWHGPKADRGYIDRWKVLVDNQFDPDTDIKRDNQGLWQLVDHGDARSVKLRDDIRRYFRGRNEDHPGE